MTEMQNELAEMKLRRLKDALRASGHYATYFHQQVVLNSMKTVTYQDFYIVTDDQTGEYKTFWTEWEVIAYLNETGDTSTMPELQRPILRGSESTIAADIKSVVELVKLRQALEFYALLENYKANAVDGWETVIPIDMDSGKIAREALGMGEIK